MEEQARARGLHQASDLEPGDRQLLQRFVADGDEVAFARLVQRHNKAVWAVCRRMLQHEQDAEDAFQAVFIALARNAASIRNSDTLACWLYGVACRVALKARRTSFRRQDRERKADAASTSVPPPWSEAAWRELQVILNDEVQRLPEKLRAPFILCCLEGMSKLEASRELNWKEGTVSGRLAEARKLLQSRLARRGISLAAVLTAFSVAQQTASAAPAILIHGTVQAASHAGTLSPAVAALAESAAPTLVPATVKFGLVAVCLAALAAGLGVAAYGFSGNREPEPAEQKPAPAKLVPPRILAKKPIDERVFVAAFSPDSTKLVTAGAMRDLPGQIKIWSIPKGVELARVADVPGVRTAVFAPDGKTILTGDFNGNIKVRDARDGVERRSIKAHERGVNCIVYSPDGASIVSTGLDGGVKLWNAKGLTEKKAFTGHTAMVYTAAFFRDGHAFVTGCQDGTAKIWDVHTGKPLHTLRGHKGGIEMVAISADDKTVVTASWDRTIKLWNADTGEPTGDLTDNMGSVFAIAFTPDGKHLVSAGADNVIRLWNVADRKMIKVIGRHKASVWALSFSPDQRYLASGSFDKAAILWDAEQMHELTTLQTAEPGLVAQTPVGAKNDKDPDPPAVPKGGPEQEPVLELLEDNIDFFVDNLTNNGASDGSVASPADRGAYSGKRFLSVTPFQRFNTQMPNWNYKIAENPKAGEFRYIRLAWKRTVAPGIMLQLHARSRTWHRYYAGSLSENVQKWRPMMRIADEPPRDWVLVTRDLYKDFGPITISGIGFSALEGGGEAHYDHVYLGRTIEDLDRMTASVGKPPEPIAVPEVPDSPTPSSRGWLLPAAAVMATLVFLVAMVLLVKVMRRPSPTPDEADAAPSPAAPIVCECKECGKKLKVKSALAGKTIKCPQCRKSIPVPSPDSPS